MKIQFTSNFQYLPGFSAINLWLKNVHLFTEPYEREEMAYIFRMMEWYAHWIDFNLNLYSAVLFDNTKRLFHSSKSNRLIMMLDAIKAGFRFSLDFHYCSKK